MAERISHPLIYLSQQIWFTVPQYSHPLTMWMSQSQHRPDELYVHEPNCNRSPLKRVAATLGRRHPVQLKQSKEGVFAAVSLQNHHPPRPTIALISVSVSPLTQSRTKQIVAKKTVIHARPGSGFRRGIDTFYPPHLSAKLSIHSKSPSRCY